ncbi:tissue factor pathway inhibitor-like isoform X3 [Acipenser ruthenus]|nr:tissue factor pathway inhibitor-like isoform X3 [Acipenser ruthenus]XP_033905001.1 tissue factor pathway inhibitor-like isoform X3 [Acipenser ruthenus]XP_033905002.1 tissue factor pathway inhibitor-like isoform X3 [Acipenser ruthenus]
MDEGQGEGRGFRLFYNIKVDQCQPFSYKGSGGNGNRFFTDRMCMSNCSAKAAELYPQGDAACKLQKDFGLCQNHFLMYYYHQEKRKCKSFFYSGCGGNGNRFVDIQSCNSTCASYIGEKTTTLVPTSNKEMALFNSDDTLVDEDDDEDINGIDAGLVAGIVFGCLGFVILIAVIVVAVQSNKTDKQLPATREAKRPLQEKIEME